MRFVLLTQYYKPEMGAPQNRLYEMIKGLEERGNDVMVVTGMPNYPTGKIFSDYKGKFTCKEKLDGIDIKRFWLYASNSKNKFARLVNMLSFTATSFFSLFSLRKFKPDYIVVESPPLTLGFTAYLLAKMCSAKLVANISDLWPLSAKELGAMSEDSLPYKFLERLEKFVYKKSVFCMGQSSEIVEYIDNHGAHDVYLFRNGVDPIRFKNVVKTRKDNAFVITYAGLLGFAQGILDICKNVNFKKLGVEFHIYGAGGEQDLISKFVEEHPNSGVFYHGKVDRTEVPQVLMNSDATLIPLVKNIFGAVPSKIYESMAAGKPMIFSGEGEGQRIIEKYNLGWVSKSKDYQMMEQNISMMMNDPDEVRVKTENCRKCATDVFNRPKQIDSLEQFFKDKL